MSALSRMIKVKRKLMRVVVHVSVSLTDFHISSHCVYGLHL